jgi:hypothetical protein
MKWMADKRALETGWKSVREFLMAQGLVGVKNSDT